MGLQLFNTMGRQLQDFSPIKEGQAGMYVCGPTVYSYAHIGNLRAYVCSDILRRSLEFLGYKVKHVMNITDVGHLSDDGDEGEDKMIKAAREKGMSVWEIAEYFTDVFFQDIQKLNILKPHTSCKATEHIGQMIGLIKKLEAKGFTYEAGGNIYFSIDKFPEYGKLSGRSLEDLQAGARVEVDSNKRNPMDFVLWFTKGKFENQSMLWDSPWGKGYPGWHLECSAMSMKYLGDQFDIHTGGIDHVSVHHTNEIAQSEAAVGHNWVNYWLHNEFLISDGGKKMAKSAGKARTLSALVDQGYDPMDFRYLCVGAHYRSQLAFSMDSLESAKSSRVSLYKQVEQLRTRISEPSGKLEKNGMVFLDEFTSHISNDLNLPRALSVLWVLLKDKTVRDEDKLNLVLQFDKVLGLGLSDIRPASADVQLSSELAALVEERQAARKARDFARADQLRDQLLAAGIEVLDTPNGVEIKNVGSL